MYDLFEGVGGEVLERVVDGWLCYGVLRFGFIFVILVFVYVVYVVD